MSESVERVKAAKILPLGDVGELKLPNSDHQMLRMGNSCQKMIVGENGCHVGRARM